MPPRALCDTYERMRRFIAALVLLLGVATAQARVPSDCTQAVVGVADGWNSSQVSISLLEKDRSGRWSCVIGPLSGRLGRNGLVWGLGLHRLPQGATVKREGDGRSPAGIFPIGGLWTTTATPVRHLRRLKEVRVGPADLWVSDPATPQLYNRWVRLKHPATSAWEKREQMRQNDAAHSIKLLICHNTPEIPGCPVVGCGSSIFFHIWRNGGKSPTAGCTSMAEANLRAIIARIDPARDPVYILLPRSEYLRLRRDWRLP